MRNKYVLTEEMLRKVLSAAWSAGFDESGEGCNGEYLHSNCVARVNIAETSYVEDVIKNLDAHVLNY